MSIRVALHHKTTYTYDRLVTLGSQVVRLRPAPHARTPIVSYSLSITPQDHFLNWQQDPFSNYLARLVFHQQTRVFSVAVDLVADMTVINPFDFFVEEYAEKYPFEYDPILKKDLKPFLEIKDEGPLFEKYLAGVDRRERKSVTFLVELNQRLQADIDYIIRMEPGVQTPHETLEKRLGSCRDSAWLLVQLLRHLGLAARFVSGYLIQLAPDQKPLEGPEGPTTDFTDLHAWTEVYFPGAGWIGMDPTSGLLTGEGHIPLAATPDPQSAAPISGGVTKSEVEFDFDMKVTRIFETPRVTKPYTEETWQKIDDTGYQVDKRLKGLGLQLTMGGEPTFVSIDDMESAEWNTAAVGHHKQRLSTELLKRLRDRFAPGGLLHMGQGKWYPGESLPRWAYTCLWRKDGQPLWTNPQLQNPEMHPEEVTDQEAGAFLCELADRLEVEGNWIRPAYEDVWQVITQEQKLPVDVDLAKHDLSKDEDRRRLAQIIERGVARPVGYVLPLTRAWWQSAPRWRSGPWPFRSQRLFLIPGDSPIGLRLPLDALPIKSTVQGPDIYERDPFEGRVPLPTYQEIRRAVKPIHLDSPTVSIREQARNKLSALELDQPQETLKEWRDRLTREEKVVPERQEWSTDVVRTALCVEHRNGRLHVFMPPMGILEDYLALVAAIEQTAEALNQPVVLEGYLPPFDPRLEMLKVTPDPGVIEVNVQPASNWDEMKEITLELYEEARLTRLGTEKFQLDGKHTGTGGGNHIVMGGPAPSLSPFLNRPDLLRSLICYWVNHPSLSYMFAGQFIGPTSQAPRIDEGRRDSIYELEIAFDQIPEAGWIPPWIVDRVFRHLLVDLTGNTHRAEICIDKLYSPDHAAGRLGLVELRGFEMPPHAQMSLAQQLLVRSLVAMFAEKPYNQKLARWGTALHDRFMLPYYLENDFSTVIADLNSVGIPFQADWFKVFSNFRCPLVGEVEYNGIQIEIRQAIEPWYVLGEEPGGGGTTRYVDSSVERVQVLVRNLYSERYAICCNSRILPLQKTTIPGVWVCGVRYRAWQPPSCLHPTIPIHTPLVFDLVDQPMGRSLGGCRYHVDHPGGLNPSVFPINALEAESRRMARFFKFGHTPGPFQPIQTTLSSEVRHTLDLRRWD